MKAETASFQLPKLPDAGKAIVYAVGWFGLPAWVVWFASTFLSTTRKPHQRWGTPADQHIISCEHGTHEVIQGGRTASMGIIMARNSVSKKIDEVQGKYQVKQLQLGTILKADK